MLVQPYLIFNGRCEEALNFYKNAIGAEVTTLMRFKDNPEPNQSSPGVADKIMHSSFRVGETDVMASDGRCDDRIIFQGFALSITAVNAAEADNLFAALSEGGQVQMPMTETFFSPRFGMVADKFGVSWMVLAERKKS